MAGIISPRHTDRLFFPPMALLLGVWLSDIGAGLLFSQPAGSADLR